MIEHDELPPENCESRPFLNLTYLWKQQDMNCKLVFVISWSSTVCDVHHFIDISIPLWFSCESIIPSLSPVAIISDKIGDKCPEKIISDERLSYNDKAKCEIQRESLILNRSSSSGGIQPIPYMVVKKCTSCTSGTFDCAALLFKVSEVKNRWEIESKNFNCKF